MEIRSALPAEFDALADLHLRSSLHNEADRAWVLANPDTARFEGVGLAEGHVRVAIEKGRIVGFATTLPTAGALELEDLFVDPVWMRRGIATSLIADAKNRARAQGVARIVVTANDEALAFYQAVGFVATGMVATAFRPGVAMYLDVSPSC